jgi:hypothetical protein
MLTWLLLLLLCLQERLDGAALAFKAERAKMAEEEIIAMEVRGSAADVACLFELNLRGVLGHLCCVLCEWTFERAGVIHSSSANLDGMCCFSEGSDV